MLQNFYFFLISYIVLLLRGRFALVFSCIIAITNQQMLGEKTTVVVVDLFHGSQSTDTEAVTHWHASSTHQFSHIDLFQCTKEDVII